MWSIDYEVVSRYGGKITQSVASRLKCAKPNELSNIGDAKPMENFPNENGIVFRGIHV